MIRALPLALAVVLMSWGSVPSDAQERRRREARPEEVVGIMACVSAYCFFIVLLGLGVVALKVGLAIFAYTDAKNRGDQNAVVWVLVVLFTNLIGFVIYLIARPKGNIVICTFCHKKRLDLLSACPHCSAGAGGAPMSGAKNIV